MKNVLDYGKSMEIHGNPWLGLRDPLRRLWCLFTALYWSPMIWETLRFHGKIFCAWFFFSVFYRIYEIMKLSIIYIYIYVISKELGYFLASQVRVRMNHLPGCDGHRQRRTLVFQLRVRGLIQFPSHHGRTIVSSLIVTGFVGELTIWPLH